MLLQSFQGHFLLSNLDFLLLVELVPQHHLFVLLLHDEATTIELKWLVLVEDLGYLFEDVADVLFVVA